MELGAKILIKNIKEKKRTAILVDCDADGYTSSAVLTNYLYKLFPTFVESYITFVFHKDKDHGLKDCFEEIKDYEFIIIPDAGSNDYSEHEELYKMEKNVLILDHHEAEKESEYACVINNQLCDYPTKSLSGVGIVYKFCSYLDSLLEVNYSDDLLDLVALGLVGDMVDIRDFETKRLITKGFENIKSSYFSRMASIQSFPMKGKINPTTVAFYIVPYINAVTRIGTKKQKQQLFYAMLEHKAYMKIPSTKRGHKGEEEYLLDQAIRMSQRTKERQTEVQTLLSADLIEQIEKENLLEHKILIVKSEQTSKNMRGYIANQLMSKYQRPVMVVAERNGNLEGSARGYSKSAIRDFRQFVSEQVGVNYAQGHDNAFGVSIQSDFFNSFVEQTDKKLSSLPNEASYFVDFIYQNGDFNKDEIFTLIDLESHWGQFISSPLVAIENLKITTSNIVLMSPDKNPTLKITLPNGVELIKFRFSKEEYEKLLPPSSMGCTTINLIGKKYSINSWQNKITPQIEIEDYEIINSNHYYF